MIGAAVSRLYSGLLFGVPFAMATGLPYSEIREHYDAELAKFLPRVAGSKL
jgi:hypothetical protein